MHQTNHRGHHQTSTATTQNQLAYKACADGAKYRHARTIKHIGVVDRKWTSVLHREPVVSVAAQRDVSQHRRLNRRGAVQPVDHTKVLGCRPN